MRILRTWAYYFLFLLFTAVLLSACKKEEEETVRSYLSGYLSVGYVPPYCYGGDTLEFTLSGVSYPSTETDKSYTLGAYYTISDVQEVADTVFNAKVNPYTPGCKFKIVLPDSLATYTILISIYPSASDKYYTSSNTSYVVTVDDFLSIVEINPYLPMYDEIFTDPRDGNDYAVVTAGGKKWLSRNLAYAGTSDKVVGLPYSQTKCMNYIFGRFYNWNEAQSACPDGWRLPSSAEWDLLGNVSGDLMVDAYFNGTTKLWEYWPDVKITNSTCMGFIPAGYCNNVSRQFSGTMEYAAFWTTEYGVFRYVYVRDPDFKSGFLDPDSESMPIRCIKND